MGYKIRPVIKLDFEELGDNDGVPFFVEMKNPKLLTYNEKMEFAAAGKGTLDEDGKMQMTQENINVMGKCALTFVTDWNLLSIDDEQPVNITDEDVIKKIPGEVITAIQTQLGASFKKKEEEVKNS